MVIYSFLTIFSLLLVGLFNDCNSKAILKLRIYNYRNSGDIRDNGQKCENFHWLNDYCDPMFHICVTSRYNCDVENHWVEHWKNKKYVYSVYTKTLHVDNLKNPLYVKVKAVDHDRYDAHDHIASFRSYFNLRQQNHNYQKQMDVEPWGLNVHLYASIVMQCQQHYYGPYCDVQCIPKMFNYDCDRINGEKMCNLNCGQHGRCNWDINRKIFTCKCTNGWIGRFCRDCSKLVCNKKCENPNFYRICTCKYNSYVEKCEKKKLTKKRTLSTMKPKRPTKEMMCKSTTTKSTSPHSFSWKKNIVSTKAGQCFDFPFCKPSYIRHCDTLMDLKRICPKLCDACPGSKSNSTVSPWNQKTFQSSGSKRTSKKEITTTTMNVYTQTSIKMTPQSTISNIQTSQSFTKKLRIANNNIQVSTERIPNRSKSTSLFTISTGETRTEFESTSTKVKENNRSNHMLKIISKTKSNSKFSKNSKNLDHNQETPMTILKDIQQLNLASIQHSQYNPTSIMIICLLILLCICVISLVFVIGKWKNKEKININRFRAPFYPQRPLPAVTYEPNNPSKCVLTSVFSNSRLPDIPKTEYDQCTIQSEYLYATPLLKSKRVYNKSDPDIYDEPILNNLDSMTCETDVAGSDNDSEEYEIPCKGV